MKSVVILFLLVLFLMLPFASRTEILQRTISGTSDDGQSFSFEFTIDFTKTGGDFDAGTGAATAAFTLENTSALYTYESPPIGNPILTAFCFNVPPTACVYFVEACILAGSSVLSTGTVMAGVPVPAGCRTLTSDEDRTAWYELQWVEAAGFYGIFTNSLEAPDGVKAGLIDPEVLVSCVAQGDIYSPLVVAGQLRHTINLENLNTTLDCAEDFLNQCTMIHGAQHPSAFGGKFQSMDESGEGSGFAVDRGNCFEVNTSGRSWSEIKDIYRN